MYCDFLYQCDAQNYDNLHMELHQPRFVNSPYSFNTFAAVLTSGARHELSEPRVPL